MAEYRGWAGEFIVVPDRCRPYRFRPLRRRLASACQGSAGGQRFDQLFACTALAGTGIVTWTRLPLRTTLR